MKEALNHIEKIEILTVSLILRLTQLMTYSIENNDKC